MENIRFMNMGDSGLQISFGDVIAPEINGRVMALEELLRNDSPKGIIELVPTYCTLLIVYNPLILGYDELTMHIKGLLSKLSEATARKQELVEIPVVYGGEYGPDLEEVAKLNNLTPEEVIARHCAPKYPVYMLGFVAGFPYLGGMDKSIATPRKKTPRLEIPAGSVGIAGEQTGIYSVVSPGGWQIIGRTPLKLYDADRSEPILLKAGQLIKFKPISKEEFEGMEG